MQFYNMPKKGESLHGIIESNSFNLLTSKDYMVCEISLDSQVKTLSDIISALQCARDAGYEQAIEEQRQYLGINLKSLMVL